MFPHPFFSVLVALAMLLVSSQAAPPVTSDGADEYLSEHNLARSMKHVFESLEWSDKLAKDAGMYARYRRDKYLCTPGILDTKKYGVGYNQWLGDIDTDSPRDVVKQWVKDRFYFNEANNSCMPANYPCGNFTQVVWRNTKYLGCAKAACGPGAGVVSLTVCFYYPPGNIPGESPYG